MRLRIAALLVIGVFSFPVVNAARLGTAKPKPSKLDRVLAKAADSGDASPQRVIVRTRRGQTSTVADRLKKHGGRVESEHRRLDSFTATVHGNALRDLEAGPRVQGVSVDAIVAADRFAQGSGQADAPVDNLLLSALGLADTATRVTRSASLSSIPGSRRAETSMARAPIASSTSPLMDAPRTRTTITATARMSRI